MSRFVCGRWGASNNGFLARGWFRSLLALLKNDPALIDPCGPWKTEGDPIHVWGATTARRPSEKIMMMRCEACGQVREHRVKAAGNA